MSSSESSAIYDDDEETDFEDEVWRAQKFGNNKRKNNRIIDESDEPDSSSEEDENLENLEKNGRLTPSIEKAIRRSIFNLSLSNTDQTDDEEIGENINNQSHSDATSQNDDRENSDDNDQSQNEDDEEANYKETRETSVNSVRSISESSHEHIDSTQDSFHENKQRKSRNSSRFSSLLEESHETDMAEKNDHHTSKDTSKLLDDTHYSSAEYSAVESEKSSSEIEVIRPNSNQQRLNFSSSSVEISHIDSATEESINEEEHPEVINAAKEELNGTTLDHKSAQKKALLVHKLNKINVDLQHMNIIASNKQQMSHLPDKGRKLLTSIESLLKEREITKAKIEKLEQLEKTNATPPQSNLSRLRDELLQKSYGSPLSPLTPLGSSDESSRSQLESPEETRIKILSKPTLDHDIDNLGKKALKTLETQQALTVDRLQDLHGSLVTRPTENEEAPDPRGLRVKLMPHQKHALAWLLWRENQKPAGGVLADDMGLGKTLTMISLVMATKDNSLSDEENEDDDWIHRKKSTKFSGGTLVVCPASLVSQWAAEVKNRCNTGQLLVEVYHGNNRTSSARTLAKNDIVITTYQLLAREMKANAHNKMLTITWKRVILDEAHVIRNHKSQTCEAVCNLYARKRWALTGTPIHNKELDLYSILKFLKCSPFDDLKVWKRWVDNKNAAGHERLATVMKSLMLRRTKQELMMKGQLETLPEKFTEEINIDLDPEERLIYEKLLVFSQTLFAQFLAQRAEKEHMFEMGAGKFDRPFMETSTISTKFNKAQLELMRQHKEVKSHMILALILRLRQVCCHPSLIHSMLDRDDIESNDLANETGQGDLLSQMNKLKLHDASTEDNDEDLGLDERVKENLLTAENPVFKPDRMSSKFRVIIKKVKEILAKKEKLIIVSQWTTNLNILANFLSSIKGATYKMFTGSVAIKNRQQIVDDFNDQSSGPQILLLSLTAGGVGLNLVGANHLMLIDIHWNPQLESQAQDRIYRFGQKRNVFVYKLICNGTIEERIKNLQDRKLSLATNVLGGSGKVSSKLTLADLRSLFNM